MHDFRKKTVHAAGWVTVMRTFYQITSFIVGIFLARLLHPDDFGLIAMAFVFIGFATLMSDVGFGKALIQKQNIGENYYSSFFWLNLTIATVMTATIYFLSPWISTLYQRTEMTEICRILSINFLLNSIIFIPRIKLEKSLNFKVIALTEFSSLIFSGIIAILLAKRGIGYWSLIAHLLIQQFLTTIIFYITVKWRPILIFDKNAILELFGFSINLFATRVLQYLSNNIDIFLIGKYLGVDSTGIYDKSKSMMLFPLETISRSIGAVMFPSLSSIQNDIERIQKVYLRSTRTIALFAFPMMFGMFIVSDSFVHGVIGSHWEDIIPILQVFCFAGLLTCIVTVTGSIYLSQGAAKLQFKVNIFTQTLKISLLAIGLFWGVLGVVISFTIAILFNSLITMHFAGKLIKLPVRKIFQNIFPILIPNICMALVIYSLEYVLIDLSPLRLLTIQILVGIISYFLFLIIFRIEAFLDFINIVKTDIIRR